MIPEATAFADIEAQYMSRQQPSIAKIDRYAYNDGDPIESTETCTFYMGREYQNELQKTIQCEIEGQAVYIHITPYYRDSKHNQYYRDTTFHISPNNDRVKALFHAQYPQVEQSALYRLQNDKEGKYGHFKMEFFPSQQEVMNRVALHNVELDYLNWNVFDWEEQHAKEIRCKLDLQRVNISITPYYQNPKEPMQREDQIFHIWPSNPRIQQLFKDHFPEIPNNHPLHGLKGFDIAQFKMKFFNNAQEANASTNAHSKPKKSNCCVS